MYRGWFWVGIGLVLWNVAKFCGAAEDECSFQNEEMADPLGFWVDQDTPSAFHSMELNDEPYILVFSDEFQNPNRSFSTDDDDLRWEASQLWYGATDDQELYVPGHDAVSVENGNAVITLSKNDVYDPDLNRTFHYRSGMLSTWNKFCFTGGYLEASIKMPGQSDVSGLWPAFWVLGNLARPGYLDSSDQMWPYIYDKCKGGEDVGGDPWPGNIQTGQKINACMMQNNQTLVDEGLSTNPAHADGRTTGRGAPEIDVFEMQIGPYGYWKIVSQSLQIGPKLPPGLTYGEQGQYFPGKDHPQFNTRPNNWAGGQGQDCLSAISDIDQSFFDQFHTFGLELWFDDEDENAEEPFLRWWIDGVMVYEIRESALVGGSSYGITIGDRQIPREPLQVILNLGMSSTFAYIDYDRLQFPAQMEIDWVRVYQRPSSQRLSCSPPQRPTACYIERNIDKFGGSNATDFPQQKRFRQRKSLFESFPSNVVSSYQ